MKQLVVRGRKTHRRKRRTTDSHPGRSVAPNLVKLAEVPGAPHQVWVTDITSLETGEG
jgi:transposase InsO family protein